jgi:dihydrodipicolinate synthase/N-acetylneuraminate lyase
MTASPPPYDLLRPRRRITGMSAVLLPFSDPRTPDLGSFAEHVRRTAEAGLVPAVNMDTGFGPTLDAGTRAELLTLARSTCEGTLVAGAHVVDAPGDPLDLDAHLAEVEAIQAAGALPIVFPSHGLAALDDDGIVEVLARIGEHCDAFLGFELSPAFHPAGRILSIEAYTAMVDLPTCIGAKHSSLQREPEWERLRVRDARRPGFMVLTGNDLAVDMVCYGSDYLLGISTFAPDLFAARDRMWEVGDPAFHQLNDDLQYLGRFTFRRPVPAYKHSAAQFLRLRGWIPSDHTQAGAPERPASDLPILAELADRLGVLPDDAVLADDAERPGGTDR